jgi:hypothetical protein
MAPGIAGHNVIDVALRRLGQERVKLQRRQAVVDSLLIYAVQNGLAGG